MKFQPLVSLWLLMPYLAAALAFAGWQLGLIRSKIRQKKHRDMLWLWVRRSCLLVLPAIVALGPSVQGGVSSPGVTNLDVFLAIDTTPSMGALDYNGKQQRIAGVKEDMKALAASLKGAHISIISFDTAANVILPLTTDTTAFTAAVDGMTPQMNTYSQGSTIDRPINLIDQELQKSQDAYPDHFRLLFYFGDGEQTAQSKVKSFEDIAGKLNGGAVLGYGTAKGAQMVKYTGFTDDEADTPPTYITTIDTTTNQLVAAISKTDEAALKKIASQLKVTYQDRNSGGPLGDLYQTSKAALSVDRSQRVIHYLNLYWLVAIPYAGLIFWEWQILAIKLFEMRERKDKKDTKHKDGKERQGGQHA